MKLGFLFLLLATACVSNPKERFMFKELSAQQQVDFAAAQIVLIGERHDNPVHHQIQEDILSELGESGRLSAVVFEQVDWNQQGLLSQLTMANLEKLPGRIDWEKSGWPDFNYYRPLFETAIKNRARLIAGGLPKNRLDLLMKHGYQGAFTASEIERLHVRTELEPAAQTLLLKEIFEGHCRMIPEDHAPKMLPVQRARDAALVRGWQNEAPVDGVTVFILGAGHARKEFGVPAILRLATPKTKVFSIGLQEEGSEPTPEGAFDKVWVTESYARPDPCLEMKKHWDGKTRVPTGEASTAPSEPGRVPAAPLPPSAPTPESSEPAEASLDD